MARKRITEYTAKNLLYPHLKIQRKGISVKSDTLDMSSLNEKKRYVVKVDEGVKQRMKKGLVKVDVSKHKVEEFINEVSKQGYSYFLIEEFVEHTPEEEKFLSLERTRKGIQVYYSNKGGIYVEEHSEKVKKVTLSPDSKERAKHISEISTYLNISSEWIHKVVEVFDLYFISFLEINPLVIKNGTAYILDLAVEVDSTAEFFVQNSWTSNDFVDIFSQKKTSEEITVAKLARESQAAFTLEVLNPNGSIFVLLSGGGASLVIADEVYNLGFGKELANYGEFSGNPNAEETYLYTKNVLSLLLKSKASKKTLIIGGGVANFTDVRVTFKGITKALRESADELKKQSIGIFVRRGGPHQKEGLEMIKAFLEESGINGEVYSPEQELTKVAQKGIEYVKHS